MCAKKLKGWSAKRPTNFLKEIQKRRHRMKGLGSMEPSGEVIEDMCKIDNELDELEGRKETY